MPLSDLDGRRRLIPSLEQVTCREPRVTPISSAISSRLFPRSTIPDLLNPFGREFCRSAARRGQMWRSLSHPLLTFRGHLVVEPSSMRYQN